MSREPPSEEELERRAEARRAWARLYYLKNAERIRSQARERYAARKMDREGDRRASLTAHYPEQDKLLLKRLSGEVTRMTGRHEAVADHILRTVYQGKPFVGWQEDALKAIASLPA